MNYANLAKGQLISKWFFGVVDFLQKTNENKSTWGIIVVKTNFFVHFLEEIKDFPFRNYLTLKKATKIDEIFTIDLTLIM